MTNNESRGSGGENGRIELTAYGDVEDIQSDDEPPMIMPQTVSIPRPEPGEHVAVVRTAPEVTNLSVYEQDNADSFDHDLATRSTDGRSEFWLSASSLEIADIINLDTRGPDLETVELEVEYRGWKARPKKLIREYKQKWRVEKALATRP